MASAFAFQAEDASSILVTRSKKNSMKNLIISKIICIFAS